MGVEVGTAMLVGSLVTAAAAGTSMTMQANAARHQRKAQREYQAEQAKYQAEQKAEALEQRKQLIDQQREQLGVGAASTKTQGINLNSATRSSDTITGTLG